ncbi:MAG: hypothetical protein KJT03_23850, partial [Verrucomicrobiae bacterium]|nr:hypothetical protein [Verrucomicrobiae bacterium]
IEEENAGETGDYAFVVRTLKQDYDRPIGADFPELVKHIHDEDVSLYTVDPVFICFTGSNQQVNFGYYRIYGPDGSLFQEGGNAGNNQGIRANETVNQVEGAPYDVILQLYLSYFPETTDQEAGRRIRPPGEYRIEVARSILQADEGTSIFGLPTSSKPGEWVQAGSFEINDPSFEFQGTATLIFANESPEKQPYLEVSPVAGGGNSGSASITTEWDDEHYNEASRKWEPVFMAKTADLQYAFPQVFSYNTLDDIPDTRTTLSFEVSDYWSAHLSSHYGLWLVEPGQELIGLKEDGSSISFDYRESIGFIKSEFDRQPGRQTSTQNYHVSQHTAVFGGYPLSRLGMTFGWALRTPGMNYALSHTVNVGAVIANLGTVHIFGVYRHEPGQLTT